MRIPAEHQDYLKSIGFEGFYEPFNLEIQGKEYEFLSSNGKEISEFPDWDTIIVACETILGIKGCKVTKNVEELKALINSLDKRHGVYLERFPPHQVWEMDRFKTQVELMFAR